MYLRSISLFDPFNLERQQQSLAQHDLLLSWL